MAATEAQPTITALFGEGTTAAPTDKAVAILSDRELIKGLSSISETDRNKCFKILAVAAYYFPNSTRLPEVVKDYLELSLSVRNSVPGTGRGSIVELFKREITALLGGGGMPIQR